MAPSKTYFASFSLVTVCGGPTGANVLPQSRRSPRWTPTRGERFSKTAKPLRKFVAGRERRQHDAVQIPDAGVLRAHRKRPASSRTDQERGLLRARELPVAQSAGSLRCFRSCGGLHQLSFRAAPEPEFPPRPAAGGRAARPPVRPRNGWRPECVRCWRSASDRRIARDPVAAPRQVRRSRRGACRSCRAAPHRPHAARRSREWLPAESLRSRSPASSSSGGLEPQRGAPGFRQFQKPALRAVRIPEADDPCLFELARVNPRRDREIAFADVHAHRR